MKIPQPFKIPLTIVLIVSVWIIGSWLKFLYTPLVTDPLGMKYTVRAGTTTRAVIDDLYQQNVVKHPYYFKLLLRYKGVAHQLKAGDYLFPKGSTPSSILEQISTGKGMIYYTFTIVPGWNFRELRAAMQGNENLHHTIQTMSDAEIMTRLGHAELKPEGEFFPDTYFFMQGADDITILKRSFKAMQEKLNMAWQHRTPGLPFNTSYQALIGASIIEKEAYVESELPTMAGVMVNRLKRNMLLQFDPTVIYGMGERYTGKIHRTDLVANTPYNTYVHKGLPPTPISMPSLAAINAMMHPEQHQFYYFVAQSNGSSQFSTKLGEHNKAVAKARLSTKGFFNTALARYYLVKLFSQRIYNF